MIKVIRVEVFDRKTGESIYERTSFDIGFETHKLFKSYQKKYNKIFDSKYEVLFQFLEMN